jgi:putative transposase
MPSRKTTKAAEAAAARLPSIPKELIDQFVSGPMSAEAVQDISMAFKKALIERALGAELSHHLGYGPGDARPAEEVNHRNGRTGKTVLTDNGPVRIEVPRDRAGSFEPLLIPKHERRFTGFDDKVVAMYARGMTVREIQAFLAEQYGTEVSPDLRQLGHRRGDERGHCLAGPATGADVPGGVL